MFIANVAVNGGGMYNEDGSATVTNCTFSGNSADVSGGALALRGVTMVVNSMLWGNAAPVGPEVQLIYWTLTIAYSDVDGGEGGIHVSDGTLIWGPGNIVDDPLFAGGPSGTWSAGATYDPETAQTTFTDDTAAWEDNELVGDFLNPDTGQNLQSLIVGNTATTVTVWGDFAWLGVPGASYQIHNYRLSPDSPCIDAASNGAVPGGIDTDLDGYPRFMDDPDTPDCQWVPGTCGDPPIVDMGAYEFQCPCTFNCDCNDQDACTYDWCTEGICENLSRLYGDVNFDGDVNLSDLLCMLDAVAGIFYNCRGPGGGPVGFCNVDIYPREGDGDVNLSDLLAMLDAVGGLPPIGCGGVPAQQRQTGDFDGDGHIDLDDHAAFEACVTSPCRPEPCDPSLYDDVSCIRADMDLDGDVDLADFATFQRVFSGSR